MAHYTNTTRAPRHAHYLLHTHEEGRIHITYIAAPRGTSTVNNTLNHDIYLSTARLTQGAIIGHASIHASSVFRPTHGLESHPVLSTITGLNAVTSSPTALRSSLINAPSIVSNTADVHDGTNRNKKKIHWMPEEHFFC